MSLSIAPRTLSRIAREVYDNRLDTIPKRFHVSIILDKQSILSVGTSQDKTHTMVDRLYHHYSSMHSEVSAFTQLNKYMLGVNDKIGKLTLVNFSFNRKGDIRLSKPCAICAGWCYNIFGDVYYTTNDGLLVNDRTTYVL